MSKIGKIEWVAVYVIAGIIDFIQFFLPGIALMSDIGIGIIFAIYFQLRGVSLIRHPTRLASLLGVGLFESISLGVAPAWIVDVWYIHHTVKKEEGRHQEAEAISPYQNQAQKPLYINGSRQPRNFTNQEKAKNINGVRGPRKRPVQEEEYVEIE